MPLIKRRPWLALVGGAIILVGTWFASVVAEPMLIALAIGPELAEPRSSAGGWANSNVWLASVAVACLALGFGGYVAKRFSEPRSWFASAALLVALSRCQLAWCWVLGWRLAMFLR